MDKPDSVEISALHVDHHLAGPSRQLRWHGDGHVRAGADNEAHVAARVEVGARRKDSHRVVGERADGEASQDRKGVSRVRDGTFEQRHHVVTLDTVEIELLGPLGQAPAADAGLIHGEREDETEAVLAVVFEDLAEEPRDGIEEVGCGAGRGREAEGVVLQDVQRAAGDLDHSRPDVGAAEIERHESAALGPRRSADEGRAHRDGASVPRQTAAHLGLEDGD